MIRLDWYFDDEEKQDWEVLFNKDGIDEVADKLQLTTFSRHMMLEKVGQGDFSAFHVDIVDGANLHCRAMPHDIDLAGISAANDTELLDIPYEKVRPLFNEYARWLDD